MELAYRAPIKMPITVTRMPTALAMFFPTSSFREVSFLAEGAGAGGGDACLCVCCGATIGSLHSIVSTGCSTFATGSADAPPVPSVCPAFSLALPAGD
jgi:hypothetical protein